MSVFVHQENEFACTHIPVFRLVLKVVVDKELCQLLYLHTFLHASFFFFSDDQFEIVHLKLLTKMSKTAAYGVHSKFFAGLEKLM